MTWIGGLADFAKRLLQLQGRVEKNTEDIAALRKDLNDLTEFTRRVAYAVKRNQDRNEDAHKILVLELKNELLTLENRLTSRDRSISTGIVKDARQLAESNGKVDSNQGV